MTLGQKISKIWTSLRSSWGFVILQTIFTSSWIICNTSSFLKHWDPYPFILLNLILSIEAAFTMPIIMMSQSSQAEQDRAMLQKDLDAMKKAEQEILLMQDRLALLLKELD